MSMRVGHEIKSTVGIATPVAPPPGSTPGESVSMIRRMQLLVYNSRKTLTCAHHIGNKMADVATL